MAIRTYRYIGNEYPLDVGILLPSISVPLFPLRMSDAEIALLLDEFPHLRKYFEKGNFDDNGGGGGNNGDPNFPTPEQMFNLWRTKFEPLLKCSDNLNRPLLAIFEADPLAYIKNLDNTTW